MYLLDDILLLEEDIAALDPISVNVAAATAQSLQAMVCADNFTFMFIFDSSIVSINTYFNYGDFELIPYMLRYNFRLWERSVKRCEGDWRTRDMK